MWADGVWALEMMRTLSAQDAKFDAPLAVGTTVQVSFAVFDGGNGEAKINLSMKDTEYRPNP